jgi:hypothetical protein
LRQHGDADDPLDADVSGTGEVALAIRPLEAFPVILHNLHA